MSPVRVNAILSRRFDKLSVHGISFSDFMILYLLGQSQDDYVVVPLPAVISNTVDPEFRSDPEATGLMRSS